MKEKNTTIELMKASLKASLKDDEHIDHFELVEKAFRFNQGHIFRFWDDLDEAQRRSLFHFVSEVHFETLDKLIKENISSHAAAKHNPELAPVKITPIPKAHEEIKKYNLAKEIGENALKSGEVCVFVVAGGHGSRLGFHGPKGKLPLTNVKNKTLFELFSGKIKAVSKRYGKDLLWVIMTSDENNQETIDYFEEHNYFGIGKDNVFIFKQAMIPSVDQEGRILMKSKYELSMNPNGHGGSIMGLHESGATRMMKEKGIKYIFYYQVDNPLVVMADPVFIGYHIMNGSEMSGKVVLKTKPEEKVGVFGYINGKMGVIEYSDLSEEQMNAKGKDGNLLFSAGNIAIHVINTSFVEHETKGGIQLPYHLARKKVSCFDGDKEVINDAIKFETFVFDALADVECPTLLEVKREEEFSPTKNKSGVDSMESSKEMMNEYFASWLEAAGIKVPRKNGKVDGNIEISHLYALDKEEFLNKYANKSDKPVLESGFELYIGED